MLLVLSRALSQYGYWSKTFQNSKALTLYMYMIVFGLYLTDYLFKLTVGCVTRTCTREFLANNFLWNDFLNHRRKKLERKTLERKILESKKNGEEYIREEEIICNKK